MPRRPSVIDGALSQGRAVLIISLPETDPLVVLNASKEGSLTVLMKASPKTVTSPLPDLAFTSFLILLKLVAHLGLE